MTLLQRQPAHDVTILSDAPTSNNNGALLFCGVGSGPSKRRTLLAWDLSDFPAYVSIDVAELHLRQTAFTLLLDMAAKCCRLTAAFNEAQATWNDRLTGTAWTTAGGDFTTDLQVDWLLERGSPITRIISGLELLLDDAIQNRAGQLRLLLKQDDESLAAGHARYDDTEISAQTPMLVVHYTAPALASPEIDLPASTIGAQTGTSAAPASRATLPAGAARPAAPSRST